MKNHKQALSISDVSWASFVEMLEYKALGMTGLYRKLVHFIPSSQTCNHCGFVNPKVKKFKTA